MAPLLFSLMPNLLKASSAFEELLFLDFDGVLQTPALADWQEMEFIHELEDILQIRPELFVVVVSTHREDKSLEEVKALLPASVASRVVGVTPVRADGRADGGRQREIEDWLSAHPGCSTWVAVDDDARLYEQGCPWLVPTHAWIGWQDHTTEQVLAVLEGQPGPLSNAAQAPGGQRMLAKMSAMPAPVTFKVASEGKGPSTARAPSADAKTQPPSARKSRPKPFPKWKQVLNGLLKR